HARDPGAARSLDITTTRSPLSLDDAPALTALLNRIDRADERGEPTEEPSIREWLAMPGLDLERDSLALRSGGDLIGFAAVDGHPSVDPGRRARRRAAPRPRTGGVPHLRRTRSAARPERRGSRYPPAARAPRLHPRPQLADHGPAPAGHRAHDPAGRGRAGRRPDRRRARG